MTLLRFRNMVPFSPSLCRGKPESGYLTSQDTEGIGHTTPEELQSLVVAGPKLDLTSELHPARRQPEKYTVCAVS